MSFLTALIEERIRDRNELSESDASSRNIENRVVKLEVQMRFIELALENLLSNPAEGD